MINSVASVVESDTSIEGLGAEDLKSIRTAQNLARVFSLEDKLQQYLSFSQDEFSMKIPQLLMEDESILEEVMTEQVLRAVKALKLYMVIERCLDKLKGFCDAIPNEAKEVQNLMSLSSERLRNMYLGYFCEVMDYLKDKATNLRKNLSKLCVILDNFDPQRNSQIQKEDEYPSLINLMFHSSLLLEKELCTFFVGHFDVQTWIREGAKEVREILQDKAQEAQVLASRTRTLSIRPTKEIVELQKEMEILGLAVRQFSQSQTQGEDGHEVLSALKELSQCVDVLVMTGKLGYTVQVSELLHRNVSGALGKLGIKVPSQAVCKELIKMRMDSTVTQEQDDKLSVLAEIGTGNGTETKRERTSKHKVSKLTDIEKQLSTSSCSKKTSLNSQPQQKRLLAREKSKISVINREINLKSKVGESTLKSNKHSRASRVSRQRSPTQKQMADVKSAFKGHQFHGERQRP